MRTRGARCILTTRRDGSDRARRGGVDHARRDGADRARRDERRRPPRQRGNGKQLCGRGPRGAISISGPLGSVPGRAPILLVFSWVDREAMALSFVANY